VAAERQGWPTQWVLAVLWVPRTGEGSRRMGRLIHPPLTEAPLTVAPLTVADWVAERLPPSTLPARRSLVRRAGLSLLAASRGRSRGSQSIVRGRVRFPTAQPPGPRRWSTSRSQFVSAFARLQIGAQIYRRLWRLTSLGLRARPRDTGALQSGNSQALPTTEGARHIRSAIVATLERPNGGPASDLTPGTSGRANLSCLVHPEIARLSAGDDPAPVLLLDSHAQAS
jgi:hypothetical protein